MPEQSNKNAMKIPSCWIITEGIVGTENQCVGIANALNIPASIKRISLNEPWKSLSPYIGFEQKWSFTPPLTPPWPDIVIAAGRKSIAASRYIKKRSKGRTFTVQLQDPRINANNFDLVAVPRHDPLRGDNVIVSEATPNKITKEIIEDAKADFPELEQMPSPRVAVLIGGNSKAYTLDTGTTKNLAKQLKQLDASLMLTCSRRTGEENTRILRDSLDTKKNFFWDGKGNNPYLAMLGWADHIIVTADSASMISEACTTGKPVFMISLKGGSKRIASLHNNLISYGALKHFNGVLEPYNYVPLNDAQILADKIKNRFKDFTQLQQ